MIRRLSREREIERIRRRLERVGWPRLAMTGIVLSTGVAGFVVSFVLLHLGLRSMPLRYVSALLVAYAIFLALLRWIAHRHAETGPRSHDESYEWSDGGGGDVSTPSASPTHARSSVDSDTSLGDLAGADEFALPLILIAAALAILFASVWVVAGAPALIAELIVDGVLSASLYRKLRGLETRDWLETAVRRTIWPFAATAIALVVAAFAVEHLAPGAHSIGDVLTRRATP